MRKLTEGQVRYVQNRVAGMKPGPAYAKAFPGASRSALKCKPYLLEKNKGVMNAIRAAQLGDGKTLEEVTTNTAAAVSLAAAGGLAREAVEVGLTRAEKRRILKRIATDRKAPRIDRLRAIQLDNLMTGDNKPVRFEGEITLHGIFQALTQTTGLPSANEVIELDPNGPMAALTP